MKQMRRRVLRELGEATLLPMGLGGLAVLLFLLERAATSLL